MEQIDMILMEIDAQVEAALPHPTPPHEPLLLPEHCESYEESEKPIGCWSYIHNDDTELSGRFYIGEQTPYELQWLSVQVTQQTYYDAVLLMTATRQAL
jgi:hypothetical protein